MEKRQVKDFLNILKNFTIQYPIQEHSYESDNSDYNSSDFKELSEKQSKKKKEQSIDCSSLSNSKDNINISKFVSQTYTHKNNDLIYFYKSYKDEPKGKPIHIYLRCFDRNCEGTAGIIKGVFTVKKMLN